MIEGILVNHMTREYIDFNIVEIQEHWDSNVSLLQLLIDLFSNEWVEGAIEFFFVNETDPSYNYHITEYEKINF